MPDASRRCGPEFGAVGRARRLRGLTVCLLVGLGWWAAVGCAGSRHKAAAPVAETGIEQVRSNRPPARSEVVVLGTLHELHATSERYGIDVLREAVRRINPDYVLSEIPPDRLAQVVAEYSTSGTVTDEYVSRFPEYTQVLLPLSREMHFIIIPCSAWTAERDFSRQRKMDRLATSRGEDLRRVQETMRIAMETLADEGLDDDPLLIHSPRYDEVVRQVMELYKELFDDYLGQEGWENLNRAHLALMEKAIEQYGGEGKRFLVMFGAGHKYWFLDHLALRDDVQIVSFEQAVRVIRATD